VNPVDFLLTAVVRLADFCVPFCADFLSAIAKHLAVLTPPEDVEVVGQIDPVVSRAYNLYHK
jgi:hypothetical protein